MNPKFEIVSCPTVNLKKFDGVHDIVTGDKMSKEDFVKMSETLKKLIHKINGETEVK